MTVQLLTFYLFASIAIASAAMVVVGRNPVHSALSLVLCFFCCSGLWILAHAEFLALILILVYVGAVMTLFLFVIMMLNIDLETIRSKLVSYVVVGGFTITLLLVLMFAALRPENFSFGLLENAQMHTKDYSNIRDLGLVLYTQYAYAFEIAGELLLVAIISAICLSHRGPRNCKSQRPQDQINVRRDDRVRLVKMTAEKQ